MIPKNPLKPGPVRTSTVITAVVFTACFMLSIFMDEKKTAEEKHKNVAGNVIVSLVLSGLVGFGIGLVIRHRRMRYARRLNVAHTVDLPQLVEGAIRVPLSTVSEEPDGATWFLDLSPDGGILFNHRGNRVHSFAVTEAEASFLMPFPLINLTIGIFGENGRLYEFRNEKQARRHIRGYIDAHRSEQSLNVAKTKKGMGQVSVVIGGILLLFGTMALILLLAFPPTDQNTKGIEAVTAASIGGGLLGIVWGSL